MAIAYQVRGIPRPHGRRCDTAHGMLQSDSGSHQPASLCPLLSIPRTTQGCLGPEAAALTPTTDAGTVPRASCAPAHGQRPTLTVQSSPPHCWAAGGWALARLPQGRGRAPTLPAPPTGLPFKSNARAPRPPPMAVAFQTGAQARGSHAPGSEPSPRGALKPTEFHVRVWTWGGREGWTVRDGPVLKTEILRPHLARGAWKDQPDSGLRRRAGKAASGSATPVAGTMG